MNAEESIITQRQLAHEKLTRFSLLMAKLKIKFNSYFLLEFDEAAMREKINRFDADELTIILEMLDTVFIQFASIENNDSIEILQKN